MKGPIVLTGATGYLGSHTLEQLLERGYSVRATTRNVEKTKRKEEVKSLEEKYPNQLTWYYADLLEPDSFEDVMKDAIGVIHSASPFKTSGIKDAKKELVDPAVKGTRAVIEALAKSGTVKKLVLTSSVVAIYGDAIDLEMKESDQFDEHDWNSTSSISHNPYNYSKTVAEKEAWAMNVKKEWDLATINPGFILGPSKTKRVDSTSIDTMRSILNGKFKTGVPDLYFGIVDVRDVAKAHIEALERDVTGRHICVSDSIPMIELAKTLQPKFGDNHKIPKSVLPKFMMYLVGPLMAGFSWNYLKKNLGYKLKFDNTRAKKNLGITFRPIEETVIDHANQLIKDDLL